MFGFLKKRGGRGDARKEKAKEIGGNVKATISIIAIVKNEAEYLLEWLAHHRCLGVEHFYVADNGSEDGTLELLEKLEKAGVLTLTHWPLREKAQHCWYNHALHEYGRCSQFLAFIDADEFLSPAGDGSMVSALSQLLAPSDIGAVACEWRIHGSSGHDRRTEGLVIERFPQAANKDRMVNRHIKSIVKSVAAERVWAHSTELKTGYRYVSSSGEDVIFADQNVRSGRTMKPLSGEIVVRHYAVKSLQEYVEKKKNKGRANLGPDHERHSNYFKNHDLNDTYSPFDKVWVSRVKDEMEALLSMMYTESRPEV